MIASQASNDKQSEMLERTSFATHTSVGKRYIADELNDLFA